MKTCVLVMTVYHNIMHVYSRILPGVPEVPTVQISGGNFSPSFLIRSIAIIFNYIVGGAWVWLFWVHIYYGSRQLYAVGVAWVPLFKVYIISDFFPS